MKSHSPLRFSSFLLLILLLTSIACGQTVPGPTAVASKEKQSAVLLPTNTKRIPPASAVPTATDASSIAVEPAAIPSPLPAAGTLEVDFIDVGQGDSTLILSPEGKVALIDGGNPGSGVLEYLQAKGIQQIDLIIASHPHADHIGGLVDVLRAIPVACVVTNGEPHTTSIYESFLDAIAAAKAEYIEVGRGDSVALGSLSFEVLSPASIEAEDINNQSLVLRLAYGKTAFLFEGDAEAPAESGMLAAGIPLAADILKVAHHGSRSSSSPRFLNAVRPSVAVYSAGAGNSYGHPAPNTLDALHAVGAEIYGTNRHGTVTILADGTGSYQISTAKDAPRAPPAGNESAVTPPALPAEQPALPETATPAAVLAPTATSGADEFTLEILSVTSPVHAGSNATLTAKTLPGAVCTITVYYKSGPSRAAGLGDAAADSAGHVEWTWKVGNRTTSGDWRIVVTASLHGKTVTQEIYFTVK